MSTTPAAPGNAPIRNFSQCHVGIVSQLQQLDRLPPLLEPVREARRIAADTLRFFRTVVYDHHKEEERELFPAVLASARKGEEHDQVQGITDRLTREHRSIEARWEKMEPALKSVAKGGDADLDGAAVAALVSDYLAHARYEEEAFLPLSEEILGRDSKHMAALGMSLHLRHAVPDLLKSRGFRG